MKNKKNKTILALLWMFLSTGLGKLSSLIAQVVLGWFLTKDDFGLYALAISLSSSAALLRNGGTQQILIQRGEEYKTLAPAITKLSFLFNSISWLLLTIAAPFAAKLYKQEELSLMISMIAISIPFSTINNIFRAKLLIDHNFKLVSFVDMSSGVVRQGSTVVFAILKFGYMSFIWPILIEVFFTAAISFYFVKEIPKGSALTWLFFKDIFKESKWIMLGSLAIALGYSGQYFVIGLFEDTTSLGIYFFGFQLVTSVSVIFTYAIETVFFPLLSSLKNNIKDLNESYNNTLLSISMTAIPISIIGCIMSEEIINLVWQNKWNDAVPIVQSLILTIPALMTIAINRSVLEAKGLWGQRLLTLGLYVIFDMLIAGILAWFGDIYLIAAGTCIYRFFSTMVQCIHVSLHAGISIRKPINSIMPSAFIAGISYMLSDAITMQLMNNNYFLAKEPYITSLFFILFFIILQISLEKKQIIKLIK